MDTPGSSHHLTEGLLVIGLQLIASVVAALMLKLLFGKGSDALIRYWSTGNSKCIKNSRLFHGVRRSSIHENENAPKATDGFCVGSMFGICILSTNHFTGAAINPARAFGPLILSFKIWLIPIYLLAPVLGSIFGSLLYSYMLEDLGTELSKHRKRKEQAKKDAESSLQKSLAPQVKSSFKEDEIEEAGKEMADLKDDLETVS
jgi:Major intrinsic protein